MFSPAQTLEALMSSFHLWLCVGSGLEKAKESYQLSIRLIILYLYTNEDRLESVILQHRRRMRK
jgi:hypothetical protein